MSSGCLPELNKNYTEISPAEDKLCPIFRPSHALVSLSETYMIPSLVKEASGLFTIKSTLYMQPTKADKDSVFQCTVEYSMPGGQIKQKKSNTITINLNCEWCRRGGRG